MVRLGRKRHFHGCSWLGRTLSVLVLVGKDTFMLGL